MCILPHVNYDKCHGLKFELTVSFITGSHFMLNHYYVGVIDETSEAMSRASLFKKYNFDNYCVVQNTSHQFDLVHIENFKCKPNCEVRV